MDISALWQGNDSIRLDHCQREHPRRLIEAKTTSRPNRREDECCGLIHIPLRNKPLRIRRRNHSIRFRRKGNLVRLHCTRIPTGRSLCSDFSKTCPQFTKFALVCTGRATEMMSKRGFNNCVLMCCRREIAVDLNLRNHHFSRRNHFIGFCRTRKRWSFRKIRTRFAGDYSRPAVFAANHDCDINRA